MSEVVVVGGGPAGMMAAISAAEAGSHVTLYEQNEKTGKKLYITGKGRCNLTNACDTEQIFERVTRNASFLYSSIYLFDNHMLMDWFSDHGLKLKTERGDRVFPDSDHSSDVIRVLNREMKRLLIDVRLFCKVTGIQTVETDSEDAADGQADFDRLHKKRISGITFLNTETGKRGSQSADALILATGGLSYPSTGADGSGFKLAQKLGHTIEECSPSLVPFNLKESYIQNLQGLSLKNVTLTISRGKKKLFSDFGELLFTHFGISGPLVLTASSQIAAKQFKSPLDVRIDLKPALDEATLDHRILKDFKENMNKQFSNALGKLLPSKMIPVIIQLSGIEPERKVHSVTAKERAGLARLLKSFPATICGLRDYNEAIITRGGIRTKEVDPSTMESKLVEGLYICGEMLDCDAVTGGFNLQIAWSTGRLAGDCAAAKMNPV